MLCASAGHQSRVKRRLEPACFAKQSVSLRSACDCCQCSFSSGALPVGGLRGGGKQKEEERNFPGFYRPQLNSKNENDQKILHREASLFCGACTPRKPDNLVILPVHSKAVHVIWGPRGIRGMTQPLPALPCGADASWLCSKAVPQNSKLGFFDIFQCLSLC